MRVISGGWAVGIRQSGAHVRIFLLKQTLGFKIHTADCRLPTADCRLPTADCRLPTAHPSMMMMPAAVRMAMSVAVVVLVVMVVAMFGFEMFGLRIAVHHGLHHSA